MALIRGYEGADTDLMFQFCLPSSTSVQLSKFSQYELVQVRKNAHFFSWNGQFLWLTYYVTFIAWPRHTQQHENHMLPIILYPYTYSFAAEL